MENVLSLQNRFESQGDAEFLPSTISFIGCLSSASIGLC